MLIYYLGTRTLLWIQSNNILLIDKLFYGVLGQGCARPISTTFTLIMFKLNIISNSQKNYMKYMFQLATRILFCPALALTTNATPSCGFAMKSSASY